MADTDCLAWEASNLHRAGLARSRRRSLRCLASELARADYRGI